MLFASADSFRGEYGDAERKRLLELVEKKAVVRRPTAASHPQAVAARFGAMKPPRAPNSATAPHLTAMASPPCRRGAVSTPP